MSDTVIVGKSQILLTNDDGIQSPGLDALEAELSNLGEVVIVAPDQEMSASSHRITLNHPLRYRQLSSNRFAVQGTPADCVILASLRILDGKPGLTISGVNRGLNVGDDVSYSGTVAAASEAALQGIPAIAVSTSARDDPAYRPAARVASRLAERIFQLGLPPDIVLNINYPFDWNGEVRLTRQGRRPGKTVLVENLASTVHEYFWLHDELHPGHGESQPDSMTDFEALDAGYVSISPLRLDRTAHSYLERFSKWVEGVEW